MKTLLSRLTQHETLSKEEARLLIHHMADGTYTPTHMAALLTVFMMRTLQLDELEGFRNALLELCHAVDFSDMDTIDLCGTGGDGKDTFNISTLSAFVTAGAGINVTKHGNYGVSSGCGSSNVLEALGIGFTNDQDQLKRGIDKAGICILHAPLFHPAMKNVAPVRKALGVKTFFNLLGPLVNPSFPKNQLTGVFNLEVARLYHYLFQKTTTNFTVLYALDGYDEISLTGPAKAFTAQGETLIRPENFGLKPLTADQISGGNTVSDAARIFVAVLENKATDAQKQVVCANAGMAIATAKKTSPQEGYALAKESLESGRAKRAFTTLQTLSS